MKFEAHRSLSFYIIFNKWVVIHGFDHGCPFGLLNICYGLCLLWIGAHSVTVCISDFVAGTCHVFVSRQISFALIWKTQDCLTAWSIQPDGMNINKMEK